MSNTTLVVILAVNLPVFYLVWRGAFGDLDELGECIRYALTPDIFSAFRGEWGRDQWKSLKLVLWIAVCAAIIVGEFKGLRALGWLAPADPGGW